MSYLQGMGVPIIEKPLTRDIDRVYRYNLLRGLQHYMSKSAKTSYSVGDMIKDLEPYVKYYKDFNLRSAALEFYE